MCLPTEKEEVLSPQPHHNFSYQNPGQTPASIQKLHLGKDDTWLGFSPIKERCRLLSDISVSPDLKHEFTRIHKYAVQILAGTLTYYLCASKSRTWMSSSIFPFSRIRPSWLHSLLAIAVAHQTPRGNNRHVVKVLVLMFPNTHWGRLLMGVLTTKAGFKIQKSTKAVCFPGR